MNTGLRQGLVDPGLICAERPAALQQERDLLKRRPAEPLVMLPMTRIRVPWHARAPRAPAWIRSSAPADCDCGGSRRPARKWKLAGGLGERLSSSGAGRGEGGHFETDSTVEIPSTNSQVPKQIGRNVGLGRDSQIGTGALTVRYVDRLRVGLPLDWTIHVALRVARVRDCVTNDPVLRAA